MRNLELTEEWSANELARQYGRLVTLAHDSRLHPPGPNANDSVQMGELLPSLEAEPNVEFIDRLCEYFPELKDFDVKTGEVALFKESLEALLRVLPKYLKREPLVVGTYLMKIIATPEAAGLVIVEAWGLGDRMTTRG